MHTLSERLYQIFSDPNFLHPKSVANDVPLFIQCYEPKREDDLRSMVESLTTRLQSAGLAVKTLDFFDLVLEELENDAILDDLLRDEKSFEKTELLDTLRNYSHAKDRLEPQVRRKLQASDTHLALLTGAGRVFPFLRIHTLLEALQPDSLSHPLVIFFPGQYSQDSNGGSQLRLFGSTSASGIQHSHYRANNLEHYGL